MAGDGRVYIGVDSGQNRRMATLWWMGEWRPAAGAGVAVEDRGVLHGLGLFETMLAVDGRPAFAARHRARMAASFRRLGWQAELPDLERTVPELLDRNGLSGGRARVRMTATAGTGGLREPAAGRDQRIWMSAARAADPPPSLRARISPWVRNERSPLAGLKCTSYAENLLALADAARHGCDECLLLNTCGRVCEAATANVFVAGQGRLRTPGLSSGCLPGVTRAVVMELSATLGIPCEEADLPAGELDGADEVFLTSAIHGVVGLAALGERFFSPGPLTARLRDAWREAVGDTAAD